MKSDDWVRLISTNANGVQSSDVLDLRGNSGNYMWSGVDLCVVVLLPKIEAHSDPVVQPRYR